MANRPPNPYSAVELRRALARVSKEQGPVGPAGADGADGADGVAGAPGIIQGITLYFHNELSDLYGEL